MASSDSERSIAGMSLPQWMKNKINDRYDLDQSSFSPPTEDDSFFYIKYPKKESGSKHIEHETSSAYHSISEVLEKHTRPCQEFIPAAKITPRELGMKSGIVDPPLGVPKSTGTDDGFHGVGAACGQSLVAMAQQIVASRRPQQSDSDDEGFATPPLSAQLTRRGSKSLPASPRTSPKPLRKNPYFTNVVLGSSDNIAAGKQGWLFSYVRDNESLRSSVGDLTINEENEPPAPAVQPIIVKPKQRLAKPKPSQLREMNFWSPTSM